MVLYLLYSLWLKKYFTLPAFLASPLNLGAIVMLSGLLLVPLISLFTKKPNKEKTEEIFSCYDKTSLVAAKEVLVDEEEK